MTQLNWITLHVNDMEKSLYFYTELLGMEIAEQIHGYAEITMLQTESGVKIELIRFADETVTNAGNGVSIGLSPKNPQQLIKKLKDNGCQVSEPLSPNPHLRFCFVTDPDGYNIQLVEHL